MKWDNKGHKFDVLAKIFKKNNRLLLLEKKHVAKNLKRELEFLGIKIDANSFLLEILKIFPKLVKNKVIIVSDDNQKILKELLKVKYRQHNENIFLASDFLKNYLSIFALYVCGKVYENIMTCIVVTTSRFLNFKYCLNYERYIKNKKYINIKDIKKDINIFFYYFDRVKYFSLIAREPTLHPQFNEIISYICKNYRNKINVLGIATNGTMY